MNKKLKYGLVALALTAAGNAAFNGLNYTLGSAAFAAASPVIGFNYYSPDLYTVYISEPSKPAIAPLVNAFQADTMNRVVQGIWWKPGLKDGEALPVRAFIFQYAALPATDVIDTATQAKAVICRLETGDITVPLVRNLVVSRNPDCREASADEQKTFDAVKAKRGVGGQMPIFRRAKTLEDANPG